MNKLGFISIFSFNMKYLFHCFYRAAFFIRKSGDPEIRAWMVFSIAQIINLYSFSQIYVFFFLKNGIKLSTTFSLITSLLILFINYYLFLYKDKYLVIVENHSRRTKPERYKSILIGYFYVIVTIFLLFYAKGLQFS